MKKSVREWLTRATAWLHTHRTVLLVLVAAFAADRVTKEWARTVLVQGARVVCPFFHLRYVENTGAAFGMMQGGNWVLIGVMLGIIGYVLVNWKELCAQGAWAKWGSVLILAGALGNLYDRIVLGYVVDFLDFLVWPVFNVADSVITVGAGCFIISLLLNWKQKQEENEKDILSGNCCVRVGGL